MKIRNGFVSNSSSSSFTCDVCGTTESGMDMCLSDAEMVECKNGHYVCKSHLEDNEFDVKTKRKIIEEYYEDNEESLEKAKALTDEEIEDESDEDGMVEEAMSEMNYEYPTALCPICQFKEINKLEAFAFLMKEQNISKEELLNRFKERFNLYEELKEYIKEDKNEN